jgi:hypothetical protein
VRGPLLVIVAFCILFGLSESSAATGRPTAARHPTRCSSHHEFVAQDAHARVWVKEGYYLFACAFGKRKSYEVGPWTEGASPEANVGTWPIVLASVTVAYCRFEEFYNEHTAKYTFEVRNLRTGRVIFRNAELTHDIVLKPDGAVAWVTNNLVVAGQGFVPEIHIADKVGVRVVATGAEIEPYSLAVAGDTLYWSAAGRPYSTPIH